MDVVWLKKDVRLHDHGPLAEVERSSSNFIVLYLYEPDQLAHKTVHGSHVGFVNEGLVDLDRRLAGDTDDMIDGSISARGEAYKFKCLTVCHYDVIGTLKNITDKYGIRRVLCHMETGHLKSFERDKRVRKWCKRKNIPIVEYNQTGVTRCLSDRDDYLKLFHSFINQQMCVTPPDVAKLRDRLIIIDQELPGICQEPMHLVDIKEIPVDHRIDREERQFGGETKALKTLNSFLENRGNKYSSGISSPNTSWTTGSRLSPYLTWGHISIRYVIQALKRRQDDLKSLKAKGVNIGGWLKSLAAFSSRMHWRSHFMQKLESEPQMEVRDLCSAFENMRRGPNDWNPKFYEAWSKGRTGFPFVDACMRCLIRHGWLNFRMRAMLCSFATYNLWLDWHRISYHLARVFLDYEPGIHYPQLQMQAGTTGINAMRVYSVTKQGHDQDPDGAFIRKYVDELKNVPLKYIHEPSKMPMDLQLSLGVLIVDDDDVSGISYQSNNGSIEYYYPSPIVDEKESAKASKSKMSEIRKQASTKQEAQKVYHKHGSRKFNRQDMNGSSPKALSSTVKRVKTECTSLDKSQQSIKSFFASSSSQCSTTKVKQAHLKKVVEVIDITEDALVVPVVKSTLSWNCKACTFINDRMTATKCSICGTRRESTS